ncbi:S8 family serine peptidase [Modestobacter sp. VKM Ac-2985]|uniref:S8 family serine peptidase n=1 Tax=Modestobacter sp. VKM Ac-2985 TaxID=3004139 RepID=UPI0022AB72B0|nr:S8 family serine peptidase [Modestobacter sp. VKM Ac-2985]MCZ2835950.1 S8 family serine peptidase [Modestobacter sp. VKM Ac-2985]
MGGEKLRLQAGSPGRGSGDKFIPYTVDQNAQRLAPQLEQLNEGLLALEPGFQGDLPIVEIKLLPQFLAASSFPAALLEESGLILIGARPSRGTTPNKAGEILQDVPTKSIYAALSQPLAELSRIVATRAASSAKRVQQDLRSIDTIGVAAPAVVVDHAEDPERLTRLNLFEAAFHPSVSRAGIPVPASDDTIGKWFRLVDSVGGVTQSEWLRTAGTSTFVPIRVESAAIIDLQRFNPLRSLQPMPTPRVVPEVQLETWPYEPPLARRPIEDRPLRVAVFDGGVNEQSPYWAGRVKTIDVGMVGADGRSQRHGAIVTSALLYGHLNDTELPTPANMVIDHYAAFPQAGPEADLQMYWLLDVLEEQVTRGRYDVVTISTAPNRLMDDATIDRWTSTIDEISHREGVLFIVAAGNNGEDPKAGGLNRVMVPADGTNVLAVGSADTIASKPGRAAYSAVGPGRAGALLRPSGLAFGGTKDDPFLGVDNDGRALSFYGTSCSAPLVTHSLASVARVLGRGRVSGANLRAFALHFTEPGRRGLNAEEIGLGIFRTDYEFLLDGPPDVVHVLYTGSISRGEYIPLAIPVPDGLTGSMSLRYTLATTTAVDASDSVDYTRAGLELTFRPHANVFSFSKKGSKSYRLNTITQSAEATRLLQRGYRLGSEPVTQNIGHGVKQDEGALRAEGKWDSVRSGAHTFRDAATKIARPRLDISHLAREGGVLVASSPDLTWSMLVTVKAPGSTTLYDDVRAQYSVLSRLPAVSATLRAQGA